MTGLLYREGWVNRFAVSACGTILVLATLVAIVSVTIATSSKAQDAIENPTVDEAVPPEISREGWRERVLEARRRSREAALERRNNPERYAITPEDPGRVATERVLNDDSLQRGDIVSTDKGLFVFRGRVDQPRRPDDFVPLPAR